MTFARIIAGIVSLLNAAARWLERKEYRNHGRKEEQAKQLSLALDAVAERDHIHRRLDVDPDYRRRVSDQFIRDE